MWATMGLKLPFEMFLLSFTTRPLGHNLNLALPYVH